MSDDIKWDAPAQREAGHHETQRHHAFKNGVRHAVSWLHTHAGSMVDPHAKAILNTAAFALGVDLAKDRISTTPANPEPDEATVERIARALARKWVLEELDRETRIRLPHREPRDEAFIERAVVAAWRYHVEDAETALAAIQAQPKAKRPQINSLHDEPCFYCGDPCNSLTGNPGLWPLALPVDASRQGHAVPVHMKCVLTRLGIGKSARKAEASDLERAVDFLWPCYTDDKLPKLEYAARDPRCLRLAAQFAAARRAGRDEAIRELREGRSGAFIEAEHADAAIDYLAANRPSPASEDK